MSDSQKGDESTESGSRRSTLSMKSPKTVRQSFSHGRSNSVVVETRKKRINKPGDSKPSVDKSVFSPKSRSASKESEVSESSASDKKLELSTSEIDARTRALEESRHHESPVSSPSAKKSKKSSDSVASSGGSDAETTARREADAQAERLRFEEEARMAAADASAAAIAEETGTPSSRKSRGSESSRTKTETPKTSKPRLSEGRRRTKLTLSNALEEDASRFRSLASVRRQREKHKRSQQTGPREKVMREVTVPDTITIQELANRMTERAVDVVKLLMQQGQVMKPGDIIDADMAQLIAEEMGHTVVRVSESDVEEGLHDVADKDSDLRPRPPVVTIMGHVDHGKTSLLDKIRKSRVADGEAGGITQNIGAYQITHNEKPITFLDTPGHEAFTAMRARGATVTDIAILVVAADDGVMPQTIESISHAKAAEVPLIVAINKMDSPGADSNKVRTDLLQHEIFTEAMGGEVLDVELSAKTGDGIDSLLDAILLQSELLELRANPNRDAEGTVVESQLDKGRGAVALVLINRGTLRRGDIVVAGMEWGRIRAMVDDTGSSLSSVSPSMPCEVLGLSGAPVAGDRLIVVSDESRAREISEYRSRKSRELAVAAQAGQRGSLEQMMSDLSEKSADHAQFVVKADTQGCVGAIGSAIDGLGNDEVTARMVHGAVGGITESDITLALASKAPILAFNVRANKQASDLARKEGVDIRYYSVIYELVEDIKGILSGLLSPTRKETFIGYAKVLEIFTVSKIGKVAGCLVSEGKVERGSGVRLLRDDVVIHEGELSTLKRFKDEVSHVDSGVECGMGFRDYQDMRVGDVIECFTVELINRSLD